MDVNLYATPENLMSRIYLIKILRRVNFAEQFDEIGVVQNFLE